MQLLWSYFQLQVTIQIFRVFWHKNLWYPPWLVMGNYYYTLTCCITIKSITLNHSNPRRFLVLCILMKVGVYKSFFSLEWTHPHYFSTTKYPYCSLDVPLCCDSPHAYTEHTLLCLSLLVEDSILYASTALPIFMNFHQTLPCGLPPLQRLTTFPPYRPTTFETAVSRYFILPEFIFSWVM